MPKLQIEGEWDQYGFTEEEWKSFHKSKRWRIRNPGKQAAANKRWVENNKEHVSTRHRKYQLKKKYSLSEARYNELLDAQQGACAICKTTEPTGKWNVFAVDHDHTTGIVRGLLCNECNRGMGLLKDSSTLLRAAAEYLEAHQAKTNQERKERG